MAVLLLSYGSIGSPYERSAAPSIVSDFSSICKRLNKTGPSKSYNLLKINFHISSLCQDRSGAEDFSANCWCFAAIFASGAFCNSSWWSRGAQPLLCAQIAAADNTVKQSPRAHYVPHSGEKTSERILLLLYGVWWPAPRNIQKLAADCPGAHGSIFYIQFIFAAILNLVIINSDAGLVSNGTYIAHACARQGKLKWVTQVTSITLMPLMQI